MGPRTLSIVCACIVLVTSTPCLSPAWAADGAAPAVCSYQKDIKPILEKNCVVCHACYDAPCQLKMETPEGLDRGASKAVVYKASRLKNQDTTRLFIDASSTAGWRKKGFFSVIEGGSNSLLYRMLELGRTQPNKANQPISKDIQMGLSRENQCPTQEEFTTYQHRRMHEGMPFGMAPLRPGDLKSLQDWLAKGAPLDGLDEPLPEEAQQMVARWEEFFNRSSNRDRLLARYLYEHLFLAHLYFDSAAKLGFFEVVRSTTPPGSPIEVIPTRRPADDPGSTVYYRLRPVRGSIVQKTHITYPFGLAKLERIEKLFSSVTWSVSELPPYSRDAAVNPFKTFAAIPARLRYQFLLDDAFYFVQTFIRGPVCLGNIATDVIDDHQFVMFQSPGSDLFASADDYGKSQIDDLGLDGREGFSIDVRPAWLAGEQRYGKRRAASYKGRATTWDDLWDGEGTNPNALLTVFRHFDNATVLRGLQGQIPKTVWLMDYPIFERTYYVLVANFDVFGSAFHQLQTRLYFDLIRAEAESNFLRFMPRDARKAMQESWYQGPGAALKRLSFYVSLDVETETQIPYSSGNPKNQFIAEVLRRMAAVAGPADTLNRSAAKATDGSAASRAENALRKLTFGLGGDFPFIGQLPEVTFVRVGVDGGNGDLAYTLVHNRAHSNVAFMFREAARLLPEQDTITLLRGPAGCYPNFIFDVPLDKIEAFAKQLEGVSDASSFDALVTAYGVRRTHPSFWDAFDFFRAYQGRVDPVERGIFDANRYSNF